MSRDPVRTREKILEIAAEEIHRHGYQAASLGSILERSGLSKGAFYHHFPTKHDLGLAVVEERYAEMNRCDWEPVFEAGDPIEALLERLRAMSLGGTSENVRLGCPINNLVQEMAPLDEELRRATEKVLEQWRDDMSGALRRSQESGSMDPERDPRRSASFVIAAIQGAVGLAKNSQDPAVLSDCLGSLIEVVESWRSGPATRVH